MFLVESLSQIISAGTLYIEKKTTVVNTCWYNEKHVLGSKTIKRKDQLLVPSYIFKHINITDVHLFTEIVNEHIVSYIANILVVSILLWLRVCQWFFLGFVCRMFDFMFFFYILIFADIFNSPDLCIYIWLITWVKYKKICIDYFFSGFINWLYGTSVLGLMMTIWPLGF